MYIKEQGVLQTGKVTHLLIHILLLLTSFLTPAAAAETAAETPSHAQADNRKSLFIIYSPDNTLHSNIIGELTDSLNLKRPDIIVTHVTTEEIIKNVDSDNDLIIGIGATGMKNANTHYPKANKLFISTDPNRYRLDKNKNKDDAILYMTQSYCRQIAFIKLLNKHWQTISVMDSQEKPVDRKTIQDCANQLGIKIYIVSTTSDDNITGKIKHALTHSDVLLALPDSNVYNSKTVKNILLTSYRYRKPVIGFSKNFVAAGALASIYSDSGQIAQSAGELAQQYFDSGTGFTSSINYPEKFNIDINRQVFKALDLPTPDIDTIKKSLEHGNPGKQ